MWKFSCDQSLYKESAPRTHTHTHTSACGCIQSVRAVMVCEWRWRISPRADICAPCHLSGLQWLCITSSSLSSHQRSKLLHVHSSGFWPGFEPSVRCRATSLVPGSVSPVGEQGRTLWTLAVEVSIDCCTSCMNACEGHDLSTCRCVSLSSGSSRKHQENQSVSRSRRRNKK